MPDNSFVKEIDEKIKSVKKDEKERELYMKEHLLVMDSKRLGKQQQAIDYIMQFSKSFNLSIDKVMEGLHVSPEDKALFTKLINDPEFYDDYFYPEEYYKVEETEDKEDTR